jgi:catechol 2,3-dioxygenase-like lactoylglutathione lyase family enzyme
MGGVKQIGYATFETPDIGRAVDYFTQYLGLTEVQRDGRTVYLACPSDFHSVVLKEGAAPAVTRLALQLTPDADLDVFAAELKAKSIAVRRQTDAGPDAPATLTVTDPSGLDIDLLATRIVTAKRPHNDGVVPRKLGHTAFFTPDIQATVKFYTEILGFRVSDWIGDFFVFMRCNPDHHTVNFLSGPTRGLHHIAFELNDWNHIKQACDLLPDHNLDLIWGPGRHGPGHNIYTYHLNPDGFTIEMFTELDVMSNEENGYFDPRPWHRDRPQRPKVWDPATIRTRNFWGLSKPEQPKDVGRYR